MTLLIAITGLVLGLAFIAKLAACGLARPLVVVACWPVRTIATPVPSVFSLAPSIRHPMPPFLLARRGYHLFKLLPSRLSRIRRTPVMRALAAVAAYLLVCFQPAYGALQFDSLAGHCFLHQEGIPLKGELAFKLFPEDGLVSDDAPKEDARLIRSDGSFKNLLGINNDGGRQRGAVSKAVPSAEFANIAPVYLFHDHAPVVRTQFAFSCDLEPTSRALAGILYSNHCPKSVRFGKGRIRGRDIGSRLVAANLSSGVERMLYQAHGPNADASSSKRQDRHGPLGVRIARRELGPPVPFGRAALFLILFCGGGVAISYLLIGWITNPRDNHHRYNRRDGN